MVTRCTPSACALAAAFAAGAVSGCAPTPVAWDDAREQRLDPPPATAAIATPDAAADSLVGRTVRATVARATVISAPAVAALPPEAGGTRCPASLRMAAVPRSAAPAMPAGHAMPMPMPAAAPGATGVRSDSAVVAVWWAVRADRSAGLYLSRSADAGRTWGAPLPIDTLDRSESGCERPAPSVAADAATGYVHVAYTLVAPEGPGVFYAHQMDPRAAFEPPQVIVYGDRPAATSVAAAGQRVVVAYEDPNTGGRPFVSLALSRTAGHTWAERVPVTGTSVAAERPVVALGGRDQVRLGWVERTPPREIVGTDDPRVAVGPLPTGVVVRVGRLRE